MRYLLLLLLPCFFLCAEIEELRPEQKLLEEMNAKQQKEELIDLVIKKGPFLKRCGFWQEHIRFGELAIKLAEEKGRLLDAANISNQIASTYYYLGDFASCKKKALCAYDIYSEQDKQACKIGALYLISASARGLLDFPEALTFGHLALKLFYSNELKDPLLEAKILFNLAAAYMDQEVPNLKDAENFLASCLVLTNNIPGTSYAIRARLRLAKVYLLQGKVIPAESTLENLIKEIKEKRDLMHCHYLFALLYKDKKNKDLSIKHAKKAKLLAQELQAKADLARIESLLKSL